MIDTGHGASIAFDQGGIVFNVVSMEQTQRAIPDVDTSHLGINDYFNRTFIPGDLSDPGTIVCDCQFDATQPELPFPSQATVTLTYPLSVAGGGAATLVGDAFIRMIDPPNFETDVLQMTQIEIRWMGTGANSPTTNYPQFTAETPPI